MTKDERLLAVRIELFRKNLAMASHHLGHILADAHLTVSNKRLKPEKRNLAGGRVRLATAMAPMMDSMKALIWEMPGVNWKNYFSRKSRQRRKK